MAGPKNSRLTNKRLIEAGMHKIVRGYPGKLPGVMVSDDDAEGNVSSRCMYSTHSLRATTATLSLGADVNICKVQELLRHRHVTTTQIYDKRKRAASN